MRSTIQAWRAGCAPGYERGVELEQCLGGVAQQQLRKVTRGCVQIPLFATNTRALCAGTSADVRASDPEVRGVLLFCRCLPQAMKTHAPQARLQSR
jgi:hypothetical protein